MLRADNSWALVIFITANNTFLPSIVSQLLHEKNVFQFPDIEALLKEGKQQGSPFYHDLGLDLVGMIGNFLLVAQLLLLVVEQLPPQQLA